MSEHANEPPNALTGQCRACMRRRPVVSVSRAGGGNYRRASGNRRSRICGECAVNFLRDRTDPHHSPMGFDAISLGHLIATIDTDDAREVHARWRTNLDAYFAESRRSSDNSNR